MTAGMDAVLPFFRWPFGSVSLKTDRVMTAPDPIRVTGPVFIHDAVTPCGGETLLSLRLRRDFAKLLDDEDI